MYSTTITVDAGILKGIKNQDDNVLRKIYSEIFPSVRNMVLMGSGSVADAEDIFQEALIIIYNKVKKEELILSSSFKTYLYAICDKLWRQHYHKMIKEVPLPEYYEVEDQGDRNLAFVEEKMYMLYQVHFLNMSDECQKVLRLYISKVPMDMIAILMGYKNEKYAKVKKYMCKQRLKNRVLNDPRSRILLEEYRR